MDKLYVNVESTEEIEEGFQLTVPLERNRDDFSILQTSVYNAFYGAEAATYDSLSGAWIQTPIPICDVGDDINVIAKWGTPVDTSIYPMDRTETGKGIQIVSEFQTTPWSIESVDYPVEYNRGFYLDFMPFEPNDKDNYNKPFTFYFGKYSDDYDQYLWKLVISANENSPSTTVLYGYNGPDPDSPTIGTWLEVGRCDLIGKDFYNNNHRIWIQPISQLRFIIKNVVSNEGMVVVSPFLVKEDIPIPPDQDTDDEGTKSVRVVWKTSQFKVEAYAKCWFVLRTVEYVNEFTIQANRYIELGYTTVQDIVTKVKWWAPDGLDAKTAYLETTNIYNDTGATFNPNSSATKFWWQLVFQGPDDGETLSPGTCKRGAVLFYINFSIPRLNQSNGLTPTDLMADTRFCVENIQESRSLKDVSSTLNFDVQSKRINFDAISWPQPNGRVQLQLETTTNYYVRFDGFVDTIEGPKFVDFADDSYHITYHVSCKPRWKDAEYAIFRGSTTLDDMKRSEVYDLLAKQMGLETAEISIATDLLADQTLPQPKTGIEKNSLMPKIGTSVMDVLEEIQKYYSVEDQMYFRDDGTGTQTVKMFITNTLTVNKGTMLRSDPYQTTPLVVATYGGTNIAQTINVNDREFYNDIWVIGGDPDDLATVYSANFRYPPSWQDITDPLYIRQRRVLIAINPAWDSQALVNLVGYCLFKKFTRFTSPLTITSFLLYNLYPGQYFTLDDGGEPAIGNLTLKILSMQSRLSHGNIPLNRRWQTQYECEII